MRNIATRIIRNISFSHSSRKKISVVFADFARKSILERFNLL